MDNNKRNKKRLIVIITVIVILLAIGVGGFFTYQYIQKLKRQAMTEGNNAKIGIDSSVILENSSSETLEEQLRKAQEKVDKSMYKATMSEYMIIEKGKKAKMVIENNIDNNYDMFFVFSIKNDDGTLDEKYVSGIIPLGSHVKEFTLSSPVEKGKHNGLITYTMVDENQNIVSQVNFDVDVHSN